MKLIVTHVHPDFDAFASLALAQRLHPDAVGVLHGSVPTAVAAVVAQYRDLVRLADPDDIELERIERLIVVDTGDLGRIGPFAEAAERCPVTLYDHHPRPERPIRATAGLVEGVGATVTLLVRILRAQRVELPPELASLGLLGLHEDTGSFRYAATGADDHDAAAWLQRSGGTLRLVRDLLEERSVEVESAFGERVRRETRTVQVAGRTVAVAAFEHGAYVSGVSPWVADMMERSEAAASLLAVGMEERTLVFARSDGVFDVAAALRESLGGGGHPGAALARSDMAPAAALALALAALAAHGEPPLRARALMSAPVKSVPADASVSEALGLLLRFGHNGLPVMEAGAAVGMVSRRDLDRAERHGLGARPVGHVMRAPVIEAGPDATLGELEELVQRHGIGRIPIVSEGELVGIVTRSDLLAARHRQEPDPAPAERILGRLPPGVPAVLERLQAAASELGGVAYLVGGTVRDGLLGFGLNDLDTVVENLDVTAVAERLRDDLGGELNCHPPFGTCTLKLPSGFVVDLAETREEFYPEPGALPNVARSGLVQDLGRRDFTVNALALRLEPPPRRLIDPFGGGADLEAGRLRVLHPLSLREDPTRLLRGARLAARLGFEFDAATAESARRLVAEGGFATVSSSRLRHELELALAEPRVAPGFAQLEVFGATEAAFGLRAPLALMEALDGLRETGREVPERSYLLALLVEVDERRARKHVERFHWPRRLLGQRERLLTAAETEVVDDDTLEALGSEGRVLLEALAPRHGGRVRSFEHPPYRRKVRGRDVIDLGLSPGPDVGAVLRAVGRARAEGRVTSFDDELALARRLVTALERNPGQE